MTIQLICASFKRLEQKKGGLNPVNERKNDQNFKRPFSPSVQQIFFIFDKVYSYNDTTNLCKFQKNRIKNVAFVT